MEFQIAQKVEDKLQLTDDQKRAAEGIVQFIADDFDPRAFVIGLTGPGGTGKTFITDYIIKHCKYVSSVIRCTSSTHKACRVFSQALNGMNVYTIQSTFGLRLDLKLEDFNPQRPQFNPMAKPKLDNIKLLIVDEASMIPVKLATYICNTCKEKQIKVWFIGDDNQLNPVGERRATAFAKCYKLYELKQIVRQAQTNPIINLLNMLRYDIEHKTYTFLTYISKHIGANEYNNEGLGFSICNQANFKGLIDRAFTNKEYTKNIDLYRIIAYTNPKVAAWNNYVRNTIIKDANKAIITKNDLIMSYETIVNEFLETVIQNSEEYIINDIVNFTDSIYGFKGFLVKFQQIHGGKITKPLFIIDHTDKFTIQMYIKIISDLIDTAKKATGGTRAGKWKAYFDFKKKYLLSTNILRKDNTILYERDIDYGFALTSHKSQGSTYNTVFVDLNDMCYDKYGRPYLNQDELLRRLYVACSRASKELILCYGT